MQLHTKILLGLVVGAIFGIAANQILTADHPAVLWINTYIAGPVGQVFLRLLIMIVVPLIFASIALGVAGLGDLKRVGRIGGKTIAYFLTTTVIAAAIGLTLVQVFEPGASVGAAGADSAGGWVGVSSPQAARASRPRPSTKWDDGRIMGCS